MKRYMLLVFLLVLVASPAAAFASAECVVEGPYDLRVRSGPYLDESTIQIEDGATVLLSHRKLVVGQTVDPQGNQWLQIESGWVAAWVAKDSGNCADLPATHTFVVEQPVGHSPAEPAQSHGGSQPVVDKEEPVEPPDYGFTMEEALALYSIDPSVVLSSCGTNCWSPPSGTVVTNPFDHWVPGYLMEPDEVLNPAAPDDDKVGIPPNSTRVVEDAHLYPG